MVRASARLKERGREVALCRAPPEFSRVRAASFHVEPLPLLKPQPPAPTIASARSPARIGAPTQLSRRHGAPPVQRLPAAAKQPATRQYPPPTTAASESWLQLALCHVAHGFWLQRRKAPDVALPQPFLRVSLCQLPARQLSLSTAVPRRHATTACLPSTPTIS